MNRNCELCGKLVTSYDGIRPYGPNGEWICFECGMKDEATTERKFMEMLGKRQLSKYHEEPPEEGELEEVHISVGRIRELEDNRFRVPVSFAIEYVGGEDFIKHVYIVDANGEIIDVEDMEESHIPGFNPASYDTEIERKIKQKLNELKKKGWYSLQLSSISDALTSIAKQLKLSRCHKKI